MSRIASVATALAPHRYTQRQITDAIGDLVTPGPADRALLERLHAATGVRTRHLILELADYPRIDGFTSANDLFVEHAVTLAADAVRAALTRAGREASEVDLIVSSTVTGVAAPSIDARLVTPLGLRQDVRRLPLFGLGCVAGAAGVARIHDYLAGHPDDVAVLVCVELCSLTVQRDDTSAANLVASGLFGDGAAAVVMVGENRAASLGRDAPRVIGSRSRFYPDTERVMGWDVGGSGFRIVLAPTVADLVRTHLGADIKELLDEHGLTTPDIRKWVAHPGGPKVLTAMQDALDLTTDDLAVTWESLAEVGNVSSASVLHVLEQTLQRDAPGSGEPGVLLAMGPGFCAEFVLLEW